MHTAEDIFQRLTLNDDPDAADTYRRLLQRGGGDGRATSAEVTNASAPTEQQAGMFDALLRAANMDLGEPDGPAWCFYLSRERCSQVHYQLMHIDNGTSRQEILVKMTTAGAVPVSLCANIDLMLYYRDLAWCNNILRPVIRMNVNMDPVRNQLDALAAAARQAAARTRSLNHAYTPQHSAGPHRTSGPSRKRPTLATAPRR